MKMVSLALSTMFMMMKHPMSMGLILMMQIILIAIMTSKEAPTSWYSYIMFMIMIGGLMVIFIYMTSTSSNKKFKLSNKKSLLMIMFLLITSIMKTEIMEKFNNKTIDSMNMENTQYTDLFLPMNKFFSLNTSFLMIIIMMYLFITLMAVTKIAKVKMGPLRKT